MPDGPMQYRLAKPTGEAAIQQLARVVGPERARAAFFEAAHALNLETRELGSLEVRDLFRIARHLVRQEGLISVLGLAFQIRCETYLALSEAE